MGAHVMMIMITGFVQSLKVWNFSIFFLNFVSRPGKSSDVVQVVKNLQNVYAESLKVLNSVVADETRDCGL